MFYRVGQVSWWLGTLVGGLLVALGLKLLFIDASDMGFLALMASVCLTAPAWALAFILAGSFWKPPQGEQ